MSPATVRTPTKRAIAALPESSRLNFLCAASKLVSETAPGLSSYLGSRALQWADKKKLPAPRVPPGQRCHQCGAYCTATGAALVRLGSQYRRRKHQQRLAANRPPEHTLAAVFGCQICGNRLVRTFVSEADARKVFPKADLLNSLPKQRIGDKTIEQAVKATPLPVSPLIQVGSQDSAHTPLCVNPAAAAAAAEVTLTTTVPEALKPAAPYPVASAPVAMRPAGEPAQPASQDADLPGLHTPILTDPAAAPRAVPGAQLEVSSAAGDEQEQLVLSSHAEPMQASLVDPATVGCLAAGAAKSASHDMPVPNLDQQSATDHAEVSAVFTNSNEPLQAVELNNSAAESNCKSSMDASEDAAVVAAEQIIVHGEPALATADASVAATGEAVMSIQPSEQPQPVTNSAHSDGNEGSTDQFFDSEAAADVTVNDSGSQPRGQNSVQDMHTEAQQDVHAVDVTAAYQPTLPLANAKLHQKPARFSWHKVGRVWKPKMSSARRRRT